ncbi:MAG: hypothetical protein QXD95_09130 [Nitrososphaeria archaeon]
MNVKELFKELEALINNEDMVEEIEVKVKLEGFYAGLYRVFKRAGNFGNLNETIVKEGLASLAKELWAIMFGLLVDKGMLKNDDGANSN